MDTETLAVASVFVLAAASILAVLEAVGRQERYLNVWAAGLIASALGFFIIFLGGTQPNLAVLLVGNALIVAYTVAVPLGFRAYLGLTPAYPRRFGVWIGLWISGVLCFSLFLPNYTVRVDISAVFLILLMVEFSILTWNHRTQIPRRLLVLFLLNALIYAGLNVFRLIASWSSDGTSLLSDETVTPVTLLVTMFSLMLWSGSFVILDSYRLHQVVRDDALELDRLNRLKDRVLAMTSHDLRGPLGNLQLLWTDLSVRMRRKDYESIDEELFGMVDRSLAGNQSLLENLFSFAESQRNSASDRTADLAQALAEVYAQWDAPARTKNVRLDPEFPQSILVTAEPSAVVAVLRNLVGNAVKFTPAGGRVTVRALTNPPRLEVSDTGLGMEPDLLDRVFRMVGKVSRRGTAGEQGSGFGLVLVKELVSGWGGTLQVSSELGKGTRVTVTFGR
jgi:signal transduction histidine kinase